MKETKMNDFIVIFELDTVNETRNLVMQTLGDNIYLFIKADSSLIGSKDLRDFKNSGIKVCYVGHHTFANCMKEFNTVGYGTCIARVIEKYHKLLHIQASSFHENAKKQIIPAQSIIHVNGVPYRLNQAIEVQGNSDIQWALNLKEPISPSDWKFFHDVKASMDIEENFQKMTPLTPEQRKDFLDDFYSQE